MAGEEKVIAQDKLEKALEGLDELLKSEKPVDDKEEKKGEVEETEEKSFAKVAEENETLNKSMDVAPFLAELVNVIGEHMDNSAASLSKSMVEQRESQAKFNENLVKSLKELGDALLSITKRQDELEKEPVGVKKSITAKPVERQFAKSGEEEGQEQRLTKSMVASKITDLIIKGEIVGGTPVTQAELTKFEATGQMRPELRELFVKK